MDKVVYAVEYNPLKTSNDILLDRKILEEKYEDKFTDEEKIVNNIEEVYEYGRYFVMVYYTNGTDERITDVYQVYRRLKNDNNKTKRSKN